MNNSPLAKATVPAAYEGVSFPCTDLTVRWGHDGVSFQGYRQDGAVKESTGRRARVFTMKVPLREGIRWTGTPLWPDTYNDLRRALLRPEGLFMHPLYGVVTAHVDDVQETASGTQGSGVDLEITFSEQSDTAQVMTLTIASSSTPSVAAVTSAEEADTIAASLSWNERIATTVQSKLDYLEAATRSHNEAVATLDNLITSLNVQIAGTAQRAVEAHDYRRAVGRTINALYAYRDEYLDVVVEQRLVVPETMSIAMVSSLAYGTPRRGAEIAAKNRIADPTRILAGTELVV